LEKKSGDLVPFFRLLLEHSREKIIFTKKNLSTYFFL